MVQTYKSIWALGSARWLGRIKSNVYSVGIGIVQILADVGPDSLAAIVSRVS